MKALFDFDLFVYRVGYTTQDVGEGIALARMDESIFKVLEFLNTNDYTGFLTSTDKSNFRYTIASNYKAGRKVEKPIHYGALRDFLINLHGAEVVEGMEADDALGIAQEEGRSRMRGGVDETCIVSIDKDLDQIPGLHFDFVKGIVYEVSEVEARRSFYRSLLVGDRVDNISGIYGIGKVGAAKYINSLETEKEMYNAVLELYKKAFAEEAESTLQRNGSLLHILRSHSGRWTAPE